MHRATFILINSCYRTNTFAGGGGALSLAALFVFAVTLGMRPLDDKHVTVTNNYTRTLSITLNYVSGGGQTVVVDPSTNPDYNIGSATVQSITIWGQTIPANSSANLSDPLGGTMHIVIGDPNQIVMPCTASSVG